MDGLNFDITSYLRLDPTDMIMVCISTLLIVFAAKHFFWDKVMDYLERRQANIQAEIDAASSKHNEANELKTQYEQQLANARGEANQIIVAAQESANAEKKDILHKATKQAGTIKEKAFADIEREKTHAQKEMKAAISDVAFEAAKKIIGEELDETKHKQYIEEFMEHAGDDSWQA